MKLTIEIHDRNGQLTVRLRKHRNARDTPTETEAGGMIFRSVRAGFNDPDRTIIHDEQGDVEFVYQER